MGNNPFTALQRTYISFQAWASEHGIYSTLYSLNAGIWGFVYKSKYSEYLIVIDNHLCREMQKEVFCHEVEHIMYDMPEEGYIIGMDMQYTIMEKKDNLRVAETLEKNFTY
jgi:hypothetical protein